MLDERLREFTYWLTTTSLADFMRAGEWQWPAMESIHFLGLAMLIGTVGLFDLRLLGFAKSIPLGALHRLVPWGVAGFLMNIFSGVFFFATAPDQYMYNPSFQTKLLFMMIAGVNVMMFYTTTFRKVKDLGAGEPAPVAARVIGGVSLICWLGVITGGRLITFYRPPFHWCFWC